ncbi:hypothetical protein FE257_001484 [Aspergillus nanangensis]|uniref:Uncharacterized protein n=1 Tax=Aspergillus nanangensis TaxID=2582783 RepID=A0AAD4CDL7_ASPNN|nr:hypothetical protein FE257_001484 [Aspergillus nanangensis]
MEKGSFLRERLKETSNAQSTHDVIDRAILDHETATSAFDYYVQILAPVLPFVIFPDQTPALHSKG